MAIAFTEKQTKVLNARNHNVLVSAAAGSGKTAVLVERIVRMISDPEHPVDIDRLLVVTFTRAAAAQMRERIGKAISKKLAADPGNRHLERQEVLLHHAQITTIDSFCSTLLRNNFSEIGLDPAFRVMDENEAELLEKDVMEAFLEKVYTKHFGDAEDSSFDDGLTDGEFREMTDYFCYEIDDDSLSDLIFMLYRAAQSHPWMEKWLEDRVADYACPDEGALFSSRWIKSLLEPGLLALRNVFSAYDRMTEISGSPLGPEKYLVLAEEKAALIRLCGEPENVDRLLSRIREVEPDGEAAREAAGILAAAGKMTFAALPRVSYKKEEKASPDYETRVALQKQVKDLRDQVKKTCADFALFAPLGSGEGECPEFYRMKRAQGPAGALAKITLAYLRELDAAKKEKNVIDFADMERFALRVLLREEDGKLVPTPAALSYRRYYDEVLIDEYQDSNEVQELLLGVIGGDLDICRGSGPADERRYARFMVGDVKQSIYRFRSAKPELFIEKFGTYKKDDPKTERIDLDQNFRSRTEVLDAVNAVFRHIMRREIGGVEYDDEAALKPGASYPAQPDPQDDQSELIVVETDENAEERAAQENGGPAAEKAAEEEELSKREKEVTAVAQKIRQLVGEAPAPGETAPRPLLVTDEETGKLRPAKYSDIVVLLRSQVSWIETYRTIFEQAGIPVVVENQAGYFETAEIREVLCLLETLDNPRQDIPLYGVMRGYFGAFTNDEIARITLAAPAGTSLFDALGLAAGRAGQGEADPEKPGPEKPDLSSGLREKCALLLNRIDGWRRDAETLPIHELLNRLVYGTGFAAFEAALPSGQQRTANLRFLVEKALDFEKTSYTGLFQFLRYIDQIRKFSVDYGEAEAGADKSEGVRVMTIHKSKGLEFPVCIVAGLSSHFSAKDTTGTMLLDDELGMGIDYFEEETRSSAPTLRKEAIARKIRKDSLGEELRVLYVAMTRAKEKLILVGHLRSLEKTLADLTGAGIRMNESGKLPVESIAGAGGFPAPASYMDLILLALSAHLVETGAVSPRPGTKDGVSPSELRMGMQTCAGNLPVRLSVVTAERLAEGNTEAQLGMAERISRLREMENRPAEKLPDPALAERLTRRLGMQYSHQNLEGLYLVTTVSELKQAALEARDSEPAETAHDYDYKGSYADEDDIPRFARSGEKKRPGGAERGTAVHRILELMDYRRFRDLAAISEEEFETFKQELIRKNRITKRQAEAVTFAGMRPYFRSGIAARMAEADRRGLLRREQVFVHGIPADRLYPGFPKEETILVQGIIDAFFVEEAADKSRHLVLVDYKTDRVDRAETLLDRYAMQLRLYADALGDIFRLPVKEAVLYSFALRKEIPVPLGDAKNSS